jgi:predicted glutamine amidotransferase
MIVVYSHNKISRFLYDCAIRKRKTLGITSRGDYIFTNGEYTAIHTNMENTLYEKKVTEGTLLATVPLDDFGWVNLPLNTLVMYKKGKRVYTGKRHEHLYIEDKARLQALLDKLEEK